MRNVFVLAGVLAVAPVLAQQAEEPRRLTAADYARAERFMNYNVTPLVYRSGVRPTFLPDDRFWYRIRTENGSEAFLVDPVKGTKIACDLPACANSATTDAREGGDGRPAAARTVSVSPDRTREVFIRK